MPVVSNTHHTTSATRVIHSSFYKNVQFSGQAERCYFFLRFETSASYYSISINADATRNRIKEHCSPNVVYQVVLDRLTRPVLNILSDHSFYLYCSFTNNKCAIISACRNSFHFPVKARVCKGRKQSKQCARKILVVCNKPFPSSLEPLFQSESKCEVFEMKMSFHSYGKQN